jgi:hypothetical protein
MWIIPDLNGLKPAFDREGFNKCLPCNTDMYKWQANQKHFTITLPFLHHILTA